MFKIHLGEKWVGDPILIHFSAMFDISRGKKTLFSKSVPIKKNTLFFSMGGVLRVCEIVHTFFFFLGRKMCGWVLQWNKYKLTEE